MHFTLPAGGSATNVVLGLDYNPASQVITETRDNDAYAYRGDYNVTRAYAANGLNQYTSAGPASFAYDMNGNLTSDGAVTYAYDVENRIIGATGAKTANLKYDPLGRLYEVNAGSPASATRFLYDGDALVAEYDASSGALARRYVHGSGVDEPLIWFEGATLSNRRTLRANHQGSIIAVADSAGNSIGALTYDPYGIPGTTNFGRFQYTGQIWLKELGVYHYKARAYSPTLGRFLQTDPIGYEDQVNLYAYVGNDPVNLVDPTGEQSDEIVVIARRVVRAAPSLGAGALRVVAGVMRGPLSVLQFLVSGQSVACGCHAQASADAADVNDPDSLVGKTPEEVEAAAVDAGFTEKRPSDTLGGVVLTKPGNKADIIRIMPGAPNRSQEIKRGEYVEGAIGGKKFQTTPLAGNPTLGR